MESQAGECKRPPGCFGVRHFVFLLYFFGFFVSFSLRANLSVAIVAMVEPTTTVNATTQNQIDGQCPKPNVTSTNTTINEETEASNGRLKWSTSVQGVVLGSFYYGFIITQLAGGVLAERYSGKWVFGLGVGLAGVITLLYPLAAKANVYYLVALRALQGLVEGFAVPAFYNMAPKWIPEQEKGTIMTIIFAGWAFGIFMTLPLCGYLAKAVGWESIFYTTGGFGVLWMLIFLYYTSDTPHGHKSISKEEADYIESSTSVSSQKESPGSPPWKEILTSGPFWAVSAEQFGAYYGQYTILTLMPKYLSSVQNYDIQSNGVLSSLPYVATLVTSLICGFLADKSISSWGWSRTFSRKIFGSFGIYGLGGGLAWLAFVGCDRIMAVVVLCSTMAINGCVYGGHIVNYTDLSPNFAGSIFGIAHTLANVGGFLCPMVAGEILQGNESITAWRTVFLLSASVCFAANTIFIIFGSGNVQTWNEGKKTDKSDGKGAQGVDNATFEM